MGKFIYSLLAAIAFTAPAVAMAQDNGATPVLQDFRLDPTRDPNRPRAPVRAGPEIGDVPDVVPLPSANAPTVSAPPATTAASPPAVAPTVTPAPRIAPARVPAEPRVPPSSASSVTSQPSADQNREPRPATQDATRNGDAMPAATAPAAPAALPTEEDGASASDNRLPWIVGGIMLLALLGAALFRRRKAAAEPEAETSPTFEPAPVEAPQPAPVSVAPATAAPAPAKVTRVQEPLRPAAPLILVFTPVQARTTLTGAQLTYRLTLRNGSREAMNGLAIAAFMVNADAQQSQVLGAFFADPFAPEVHRIANISPGGELTVDGELRLDRLVPIEVQGRALLIPLVAFKVISLDGDELARATFIVGQESTPPRAKMAPFRLDQGPRQFRDIGSRPAQDVIAA